MTSLYWDGPLMVINLISTMISLNGKAESLYWNGTPDQSPQSAGASHLSRSLQGLSLSGKIHLYNIISDWLIHRSQVMYIFSHKQDIIASDNGFCLLSIKPLSESMMVYWLGPCEQISDKSESEYFIFIQGNAFENVLCLISTFCLSLNVLRPLKDIK